MLVQVFIYFVCVCVYVYLWVCVVYVYMCMKLCSLKSVWKPARAPGIRCPTQFLKTWSLSHSPSSQASSQHTLAILLSLPHTMLGTRNAWPGPVFCIGSRFELGSSCLFSQSSRPLSHTFPAPFVLLTQTTERTTTTQNTNTSNQLGVILEQLAASSTIPQHLDKVILANQSHQHADTCVCFCFEQEFLPPKIYALLRLYKLRVAILPVLKPFPLN